MDPETPDYVHSILCRFIRKLGEQHTTSQPPLMRRMASIIWFLRLMIGIRPLHKSIKHRFLELELPILQLALSTIFPISHR
jgi:hypothetical protein